MDLLQRQGQYPLPPQASQTIMGVEFAGVITQLGEGASKFKEGDEVFGLAFGVCHQSSVLLIQGSIRRIYRQPGNDVVEEAQGDWMERGRRYPRELDDWWVVASSHK